MLITVLTDAYRQSEAKELGDALNGLCSPSDNYGWSSAGIYAFWRPGNRELLYIGLANDLALRFRQHNGLVTCEPKCCKVNEIRNYFTKNDMLGFSVFVQSCLNQTATSRAPSYMDTFDLDKAVKLDVKRHEGFFIETWRLLSGTIPAWNKMGGLSEGRALAKQLNDDIGIDAIAAASSEVLAVVKRFDKNLLNALTGSGATELVAKATIRELSASPVWEGYEELVLHAARMRMVASSMSLDDAVDAIARMDSIYPERIAAMRNEGYLTRALPY